MNVSLTPELEAWVDSLVRSGLYQSSSEVIRDGLRLLHQKRESALEDRLERLLMAIDRGIADVDTGRMRPNEEVTVASVRDRALGRRKA